MSLAVATPITPTNATDAQFRAWGSLVSGKLAAMGLVQTGDTGQINWTTVLAPTAPSLVQGYEVWRFNDALQATVPVFVKLEYGSYTAAANPSIWFSVGSGSNGAGALTGVLSARQQIGFSQTATPITAYWCGDVDRIVFCVQGTSASTSMLLSMERSTDVTGARTSEAVLIAAYGPAAMQRAWNCVTGPYTAFETSFGCMGGQAAPFGSTGVQVACYPIFFNKGVFMEYGMNLFAYVDATIGANVAFSFPVFGITRTYMPIGTAAISAVLARTTAATALMMRFD
jgi:hypothetical protein